MAQTPTDKTVIQRQIEATDKQIDQLVYELYGLTDDEIRIAEPTTIYQARNAALDDRRHRPIR